MRVNEEEIAGVPDVLPLAAKKRLNNTKKRPLSEALKDIPLMNPAYRPMDISERESKVLVPAESDISPLALFNIFITNAHFDLISTHTNISTEIKRTTVEEADNSQEEDDHSGEDLNFSTTKPKHIRPWKDTIGYEIAAFVGILLLQGEAKVGTTEKYWTCQSDQMVFSTIAVARWHQIKRYLKISNPRTDLDSKEANWYTKIKPLYTDFVKASMASLKPGRNVSVDEQLILFKGRSRHTMRIGTKAAGVGFKIYSLCSESYLYNFFFTSRVSKISNLKKKPGLTDSSTVVYRLCESLPQGLGYIVFMDNFFTNVKLLTALKHMGIGGCGTAKAGSGFPSELLEIRELSTNKDNWGTRTYTTATEDVLCLVWQDLGTTQVITTVHSASNLESSVFIPKEKRRGIPTNSVVQKPNNEGIALPIPLPIREYNKHMGGFDANS